jgi:cell division septum initiation protein DivIVA
MPSSPLVSDSSSDHALGPDTRSQFHDALNSQNMAGGSSRSSKPSSFSEKPNGVEDPDAINFATPVPPVQPLTRSTALPRTNTAPLVDLSSHFDAHPSGLRSRRNSEPNLEKYADDKELEELKEYRAELEEFKEQKAENEAIVATIEEAKESVEQLKHNDDPENFLIEKLQNSHDKLKSAAENLVSAELLNLKDMRGYADSLDIEIKIFNNERRTAIDKGTEGVIDIAEVSLVLPMIARMLQQNQEIGPENQQPTSRSAIDRFFKAKPNDLKKIAREAKTNGAVGSQITRDDFLNRLTTLSNEKLDIIISESSKGWLRKNRNMLLVTLATTGVMLPALIVPLQQTQEANKRLDKANKDLKAELERQASRADKAEKSNQQAKEQQAVDDKVIEGLQKKVVEAETALEAAWQRMDEILAKAAKETTASSISPNSSESQSSLLQSWEDKFLSPSFWGTVKA